MVLRLLGSPRYTNDLDYVFVPHRSKKEIVGEIVQCLQEIEGAKTSHSLNSKCLRVVVSVGGTTVQVEAKVAMEIRAEAASTRLLSPQFNLPPRMVRVTDLTIALANKMAAWNERRLMRDIYDIWFFLQMGVAPDTDLLAQRLRKPSYSRLVSHADRLPGATVTEFYDHLRERVRELRDDEIREELADYLADDEITGLAMQFRAALARLR